jgi:hypothetical protein
MKNPTKELNRIRRINMDKKDSDEDNDVEDDDVEDDVPSLPATTTVSTLQQKLSLKDLHAQMLSQGYKDWTDDDQRDLEATFEEQPDSDEEQPKKKKTSKLRSLALPSFATGMTEKLRPNYEYDVERALVSKPFIKPKPSKKKRKYEKKKSYGHSKSFGNLKKHIDSTKRNKRKELLLSKIPELCGDFINEKSVLQSFEDADFSFYIVDRADDDNLLAFSFLEEEIWQDKNGYGIRDSCSRNVPNQPKVHLFDRLIKKVSKRVDFIKTYVPVTLMNMFLNLIDEEGNEFTISFGCEKPNEEVNDMALEMMPIWKKLADMGKSENTLAITADNLNTTDAEQLKTFIKIMDDTGHQIEGSFYEVGIPISICFVDRSEDEMSKKQIKAELKLQKKRKKDKEQ